MTNIAAYQFARLTDLKSLRAELLDLCKGAGLKGTILLSTEGVNLFLAGEDASVQRLLARLREVPGLERLVPKVSESGEQPFTRMLVRIKKEIISFGVEGIDPATRTSPKLSPVELKKWLDEGRAVTLLDTRNDYEVKLGTFTGATVLGIDHFRQLPEAVRKLPEETKRTPVVMFCTGGIRCEKAGPYMEREGWEQIYQLDGGILKYFEEVGGAHYEGECFVFDQRVGVDPALSETESAFCFVCQTPLTPGELADARWVENVSCPYCYRTDAEKMAEILRDRQAVWARVTSPLPGSMPMVSRRPLNIPLACDGWRLLECLGFVFPHATVEEWEAIFAVGGWEDEKGCRVGADRVVRAGERMMRVKPGTVEPEVATAVRFLYEDEAVVVLEKPAPLPMHPGGRFQRNTLQAWLQPVYAPQKIQAAHRLDANTTGLVVCARTRHFAKLLQPQFADNRVEKTYLARVQGVPGEDFFICEAPIGTESGPGGSREVDAVAGQRARTEFKVRERMPDGTTLLEVVPKTGRTNQIRLHLASLGWPVLGDATYLAGGEVGTEQTLPVGAPPLCLHAWRLVFSHPLTQQRLEFEASWPGWAGVANADWVGPVLA